MTTEAASALSALEHPDDALVAASVAAAGWPVLPIRQGTKAPLIAGGANHGAAALRSVTEVLDAATGLATPTGWRAAQSWGVLTGQPGHDGLALVVLDVDGDPDQLAELLAEAGPAAEAWAVNTVRVSRGDASRCHLYGTLPGRECGRTARLASALEWRGDGGYVLLPGSPHPSGSRYRLAAAEVTSSPELDVPEGAIYAGLQIDGAHVVAALSATPLPIPAALLHTVRDRLARRPATPPAPAPADPVAAAATASGRLGARVGGVLSRLAEAQAGERNNVLNWAASTVAGLVTLADGDLDADELRAEVEAAGLALGLERREVVATVASGWRWGAEHPPEERPRAELPPTATPAPTAPEDETVTDDAATATDLTPRVSCWGVPADVAAAVAGITSGSWQRLAPSVGLLTGPDGDAGALFYRGKVNGVAGESGSGKTWTALAATAQELSAGRPVVYIDLEDDVHGIVARLLQMGTPPEAVARLVYLSPTERITTEGAQALGQLLDRQRPSLVVIDSAGEGLALQGANPNADEEVAAWFRAVPRRIAAHEARPAVVLLDHTTKADDGGLWPIGSQRKRAAIDGAQYMQRTVRPFAVGVPGHAVLVAAKDRHGNYRTGARVAEVRVTPSVELDRKGPGTGTGTALRIDPCTVRVSLAAVAETNTAEGAFRPTTLMERVSRYLETNPGPADRTKRRVREDVRGKETALIEAADQLVAEGYARTVEGPRGATVYESIKPFREDADVTGAQGHQ